MQPFTKISSIVAPLMLDNVDTDAIIPSREMKSTGRTGLADGLFAPWRYVQGREENPDFVLNQTAYAATQILAGGANFGCGSSREHAVWALAEWGIRAIIAESFAPIFYQNCIRNGLLPIELGHTVWPEVLGQEVEIDLAAQQVRMQDHHWQFSVDEEPKLMLLEGLDAIDLTLKSLPIIDEWTDADRLARPWVYLKGGR